MDPELKKMIDEAIAAATAPLLSKIQELEGSVGQVAEAGKKIGEMEGNLKILSDTVAAQKPGLDAGAIKELLASELAAHDGKTAAQAAADKLKAEEEAKAAEAAAALKAKRDAFVAEKLKNVPARYHADLGDDETAWEAKEKEIRDAFAADLKAAGVKVPDLGGSAGGTPPSGDQADKSFASLLK